MEPHFLRIVVDLVLTAKALPDNGDCLYSGIAGVCEREPLTYL